MFPEINVDASLKVTESPQAVKAVNNATGTALTYTDCISVSEQPASDVIISVTIWFPCEENATSGSWFADVSLPKSHVHEVMLPVETSVKPVVPFTHDGVCENAAEGFGSITILIVSAMAPQLTP